MGACKKMDGQPKNNESTAVGIDKRPKSGYNRTNTSKGKGEPYVYHGSRLFLLL